MFEIFSLMCAHDKYMIFQNKFKVNSYLILCLADRMHVTLFIVVLNNAGFMWLISPWVSLLWKSNTGWDVETLDKKLLTETELFISILNQSFFDSNMSAWFYDLEIWVRDVYHALHKVSSWLIKILDNLPYRLVTWSSLASIIVVLKVP